jgi:hypothetical protein
MGRPCVTAWAVAGVGTLRDGCVLACVHLHVCGRASICMCVCKHARACEWYVCKRASVFWLCEHMHYGSMCWDQGARLQSERQRDELDREDETFPAPVDYCVVDVRIRTARDRGARDVSRFPPAQGEAPATCDLLTRSRLVVLAFDSSEIPSGGRLRRVARWGRGDRGELGARGVGLAGRAPAAAGRRPRVSPPGCVACGVLTPIRVLTPIHEACGMPRVSHAQLSPLSSSPPRSCFEPPPPYLALECSLITRTHFL